MSLPDKVFHAPPLDGFEPTETSVVMDCDACDGLVWVREFNVVEAKRALLLCDPCVRSLFTLQTNALN